VHDGSARRSKHHNDSRESRAATYPSYCRTASKSQCTKLRKAARGRMLAPPVGSQTLLGWAWGHCRYPEDRVPPRTSFKSKMKDKTGAHARMSRGSHLLAQGSSGAATCLIAPAPATRARGSSGTATCPVAPAPISWHREAPGPSRASWLQLPPPGPVATLGLPCAPWPRLPSPSMGHLRGCHVPRGQEPRAFKVNKYHLAARPS
jgi:hypothetical protein